MMISICADAQERVTGVCPDNLTGGQGWVWIETDLTPDDNLTDERGIALYKIVNGAVVARTAEEIAADTPEPTTPEPTQDERIDQVEAALIELAAIVTGGV
jgi:hypothetical protein